MKDGIHPVNKEPEAKIVVTINMEITVAGDLPYAIKNGYKDEAHQIAHGLAEDAISCCGYPGKDMTISDVEYELI